MRVSHHRPDMGVHVFNTRGISTRVFPVRAGPVERDRERPRDSCLLQFRDIKYGGLWRYHAALPSSQVICLYGSDHRSNLFGRLGGTACWAAYRLLNGGKPIIKLILAVAFACENWASREGSPNGRQTSQCTTRSPTAEAHRHRRKETSHEDPASDHQGRVIG